MSFDEAVEYVLENEGGFVDSECDPGGATNFGISVRFLQSLENEKLRKYGIFADRNELTSKIIQDLTIDQAKNIYRYEFWDMAKFDYIEHRYIQCYIFDCCIHHGQKRGIKLLQRASWAYNPKYRLELTDDGILGHTTLLICNDIIADNQVNLREYNINLNAYSKCYFLDIIRAERAGYCRLIAHLQKDGQKNLEGWLNRCYK